MATLDGSRRNGAKYEVEVSERLMHEPGALGEVYLKLLQAARQVGIQNDRLPDFLNLENAITELVLEGQAELIGIDLPEALSAEQRRWREQRNDLEDAITERLLVAAARIGQHRFAV